MTVFYWVWFISGLLICSGGYIFRALQMQKIPKLSDVHWKGLLVISFILGLLPAYVISQNINRSIVVPDSVPTQPAIVKD